MYNTHYSSDYYNDSANSCSWEVIIMCARACTHTQMDVNTRRKEHIAGTARYVMICKYEK
jgi:hypothetical protein